MGGGVMGEAILSRLIEQQIYPAQAIYVSDPQANRRDWLQQQYGVITTADNLAIVLAEVILLAIKPQSLPQIRAELQNQLPVRPDQLVLSILAGVPLSQLETVFPDRPLIRAMPNTPATVGWAMTAIAPNGKTQPEQIAQAYKIFGAIGQVVEVPESLMDAVTGLSGSGPAYVALMIEALADGGVAAGLPRSIAQQLALQTVRGTAELLAQTELHPAVLKDRVTSPGGTTIAGIAELEKRGFRSALIEAVKAAFRRSQELGQ